MGVLIFLVLGVLAVAAALAMVFSPNPVHSVLFLVVTIIALAGLFLTLDAQFIAVLQVIVYAGAIMVLFLFVIMMLDLGPERGLRGFLGRPAGLLLGLMLLVELAAGVAIGLEGGAFEEGPPEGPHGTVENVGSLLLTRYVLPVELASLVLLAGMVGAVALARPHRQEREATGEDGD
jgi:NADH-quinone oxidoreductase subunit J